MASASGSLQSQGQAIEARIKTLVNNELREICRGEGLLVSGIKSQLQKRIIDYLNSLLQQGDQQALFELRHRVYNGGKPALPGGTTTFASPSRAGAGAVAATPSHPTAPGSMPPKYGEKAFGGQHQGLTGGRPLFMTPLNFKRSPFYTIREALTRTLDMPIYSSHRNTMVLPLKLPGPYVNHLRTDSSLRILLYCADGDVPKGTEVDITFPTQLEIKVGGEEVKANFKGLKNKPGSTRPADITGFIKREPDFPNQIHVTYALTHKAHEKQIFNLVALLVQKHSVEELVKRIEDRGVISKARVISDLVMKNSDEDIVATSSIMSLKDPISYTRIAIPIRSTACTHNQCFDASSFLQLQEQAPLWKCPVCDKALQFEHLAVDQYVQEILANTSSSVDQVNIEPDAAWSPVGANSSRSNGRSNGTANGHHNDDADSDSDEDLIEITKPKQPVMKVEASNVPFSFSKLTPPPPVLPAASAASSGPRPGQKRKSEVIDLTLSDDDEPPAKKPHYSTPTSLPDYGQQKNGYPSYPRSNHYALNTNGNVSHQVQTHTQLALRGTSRFISSVVNPTNAAPYSSPARSPAGSNREPINLISSPSHRPSPPRLDYSNNMSIPTNSTARPSSYPSVPRPPDFPRRHIEQPIRISEQRNALLNLASGRDPHDYSPN
ncbi:DNA-binding SAP [Venturia nashicola]|uniref:DNA-binding SAP n=1 Tax=Venturia nashicola TaxID=86259 RepID=A0A4Z1P4S4_9PEZI|nr:DNA-binding SAP [Venturia nashicola]